MKARPAAALLVLFLLLMSCADTPADPGAGITIDHSTDGHEVLVRVAYEGGFVAPEWTYKSLPSFSLYGDGTLVLPGAQIELYPGPALPSISTRTVTEAGIQATLEEVLHSIQGVPDEMLDMGSVGMADVPTSVITIHAGGVDRTIKAYGLSELTERPERMSVDEFQARRQLQDLVTKLGGLDTWLPDGSLGTESMYEGSGARLFVSEHRKVDLPQEPIRWPLGGNLDRFGDLSTGSDTYRCGVVDGAEWASLREAATQANELTPWTESGARFSILFRPLLPDETGC
jgi:hypothetical protein